eukprot:5489093-Ditylum_brightwellii.AAC.1
MMPSTYVNHRTSLLIVVAAEGNLASPMLWNAKWEGSIQLDTMRQQFVTNHISNQIKIAAIRLKLQKMIHLCVCQQENTGGKGKKLARRSEHLWHMQEKEKKDNYLLMHREKCKNFRTFVAMVNRILGRDAKMMLKQMVKQLALKWTCHVSVTQNYVNQTVQVAILHATHQCLRGARALHFPAPLSRPHLLTYT